MSESYLLLKKYSLFNSDLILRSLLETTKPYLMNTMRMPAAQTLLLFANAIDTNGNGSKVICDSWLCLEFPFPESGIVVLEKACRLRGLWNKLLDRRLNDMTGKGTAEEQNEEMEKELWLSLANFMNTEVYYTIKRLLPADLKYLYVGSEGEGDKEMEDRFNQLSTRNPFSDDFECQPNAIKGGWFVTEHVTINW